MDLTCSGCSLSTQDPLRLHRLHLGKRFMNIEVAIDGIKDHSKVHLSSRSADESIENED